MELTMGWIFLLISIILMMVFMSIFIIVFYMMKGLKRFNVYYPPPKTMNEISRELMCPKCGSRELKPIGYRTLRCDKCGFTFTIGFREGLWISPLFLWFPILWPILPIIVWRKRRYYWI